MSDQVYWGDLHSHCSISYGEGTLEQAFKRARRQLDFCSITGHAFWPDMPTDRDRYGDIIDYHREGFERLAENWNTLLQKSEQASSEGEFLVFPSYEWHSLKYGDHNVYARGPDLPLANAADLLSLREVARASDAILVPHHIGYAAGYRGIDWSHFQQDRSPIVEIFSLHGCSESDEAPYTMLHDMGPRDASSTAVAGWQAGHRFGVIGSTDHHGGYPGSHGNGRLGVLSRMLTRDAIWEALLARRVYAVTGDKIELLFDLNDEPMGSILSSTDRRHLSLQVKGSAAIDRVELLKNDRLWKRFFPITADPPSGHSIYRLRITWGWGKKNEQVAWSAELELQDGQIRDVETCFSGQAIVAPQGVGGHETGSDAEDLPHELLESGQRRIAWRSVTCGNISTQHATTQALSLELEASLDSRLIMTVNGVRIEYRLGDLLGAGRSTYLRGWLSEAIRIGPLSPQADCNVTVSVDDTETPGADRYRVRAAQHNGQWAWSSPIWVDIGPLECGD